MNKCLSLSPPDLCLLSLYSPKTRAFLCKREIIGLTCFGGEKVSDYSKGKGCSEEKNKAEERTEVILSWISTSEAADQTGPDRTGYRNMETGKIETEDKMEGVSEGKTGVKKLDL